MYTYKPPAIGGHIRIWIWIDPKKGMHFSELYEHI